MKTDDGQHLPKGEKKLPLSHRISSSITLQMYLSKVTRCGFQTDSPLICSSSIWPPLFFPHPGLSVPPPPCPRRTDDHQSLQNWKFPQNSGSRRNLNSSGVTWVESNDNEKERKCWRRLSALHAADEVIKFVAWHCARLLGTSLRICFAPKIFQIVSGKNVSKCIVFRKVDKKVISAYRQNVLLRLD